MNWPPTSHKSHSTAFASTPYACQYAKRVDMKGTKRLIAQQVTSQQQVEYTIRYRDDVSETDRLINEDGIAFEILQIAKLGRREALSLLCRAVMT